jgi:hypothetical protein
LEARIGRNGASKSVTKHLFPGISEGRLQHDTAIVLDPLDHLVRRHFLHKWKQGGVTGADAFGKLLHELVIDGEVRQRATGRAARRPKAAMV